MYDEATLDALRGPLATLAEGHADLPAFQARQGVDLAEPLQALAERLQDNYPYAHPFYAGQMLKPPAPIARAAYSLAMYVNPNNHALDGGRATSALEKEAVAELAAMCGWGQHLGHLCSGGTVANMEALWVAGRETGGAAIVASEQAHYTHSRLSAVLQLPFFAVASDRCGRLDPVALEQLLQSEKIGTVVVTLGTTSSGAVDPLPAVLALQQSYGFRVHVDAAYGGYYQLVDTLGASATAAFAAIDQADSIVIDPHKHGLQPYGCGCVLFRDPAVGRHYRHESPYTYFTSDELHLGEISLECSRPGAAAAALWATQRQLPLQPGGEFSAGLAKSRAAALALYHRLQDSANNIALFEPELDIVVWAPEAASLAEVSRLSQRLFDGCARAGLHLALLSLPAELLREYSPELTGSESEVTCLRSCLMKPEHLEWLDRIWQCYSGVQQGL